jgi:hypothetical protein
MANTQHGKEGDGLRNSRLLVAAAIVMALLPFAYVVSFGPANWLASHSYIDSNTLLLIYWPLMYFYHRVIWFEQFINWYLSFWK